MKVCYISKFKYGSEVSEMERIFIEKFFDKKVHYLCKEKGLDTLELSSNCNILVGIASTILREAYAIGTKIIV